MSFILPMFRDAKGVRWGVDGAMELPGNDHVFYIAYAPGRLRGRRGDGARIA